MERGCETKGGGERGRKKERVKDKKRETEREGWKGCKEGAGGGGGGFMEWGGGCQGVEVGGVQATGFVRCKVRGL